MIFSRPSPPPPPSRPVSRASYVPTRLLEEVRYLAALARYLEVLADPIQGPAVASAAEAGVEALQNAALMLDVLATQLGAMPLTPVPSAGTVGDPEDTGAVRGPAGASSSSSTASTPPGPSTTSPWHLGGRGTADTD